MAFVFVVLFALFVGIQWIIMSMNWTPGTLPYISDGVAGFFIGVFFFCSSPVGT